MVKDKSHRPGWSPGRCHVLPPLQSQCPAGRSSVRPDAPRTHVDFSQARELRDARPESRDSSSNHCTAVARVSLMRTRSDLSSRFCTGESAACPECGVWSRCRRHCKALRDSAGLVEHPPTCTELRSWKPAPPPPPRGGRSHGRGFTWNDDRFASRAEAALSTAGALGFF